VKLPNIAGRKRGAKEDDGFQFEADAIRRLRSRVEIGWHRCMAVALLRAAIEGLTAARENIEIPDYEPTLERTERY
jgi:hypothetical protein